MADKTEVPVAHRTRADMTHNEVGQIISAILGKLENYIVPLATRLVGTGRGFAFECPGLVVVVGDAREEPKPAPKKRARRAR